MLTDHAGGIRRHFTTPDVDPLDAVEWSKRPAWKEGDPHYRPEVEAPASWSQTAVDICAKLYLADGEYREDSVRDLIERVTGRIGLEGAKAGYFGGTDLPTPGDDDHPCIVFVRELQQIMVEQRACFNSPVLFNIGRPDRPQCPSACFLLGVEDTSSSILDWTRDEAFIFKAGAGSGTNLSHLRGSMEPLSTGGIASGPVSFMRLADAGCGTFKSGGVCLAPWQRVYTAIGPVAVSELDGKEFVTLSYDPPAGRYKAKRARAWRSGVKQVIEVVTDKGRFYLSDDHPVKLSTGEFRKAGDLSRHNSLFACSIDEEGGGYRRVHLRNGVKGKEKLSRLVASDVMGCDIVGMSVHHGPGGKLDDNPDNLSVMTQGEHASLHGREAVARGEHPFQIGEWSHGGDANGMHSSGSFWSDTERSERYREQKSIELLERGSAREMQVLAGDQRMLNLAYDVLCSGYSIDTFEQYVEGRLAVRGDLGMSRARLLKRIEHRFGSYDDFKDAVDQSNHRVVEVNPVGFHPVYDVEVDCPTVDDKSPLTGHNFVIWDGDENFGQGIVVANTRRGAKLVCLDDDHPDVRDFITSKAKEEQRLRDLAAAGYDISMSMEGERLVAEATAYQNANNSVRLSDAFMRKATGEDPDSSWPLVARKKGVFEDDWTSMEDARELLDEIAKASWDCADPGAQFHDTINSWHTTPADGPIRTTNPCAETSLADDSSCNLASINVLKFVDDEGVFDVEGYRHTVDVMVTAMDILVDFCELPTDLLTRRTKQYRWLGLGYTNMGAAIMAQGMPYDSDDAREFAAAVTALTTGRAYRRSSELAQEMGPFEGFDDNRDEMLSVISRHKSRVAGPASSPNRGKVWDLAREDWDDAVGFGLDHGYRNAQATVIAPAGSISFFMDADTTGIEPCWGLVTHKDLAGGGSITIVNQIVERALDTLNYDDHVVRRIMEHLTDTDVLPTTAHLNGDAIMRNDEHNSVFDGANDISPEGHVRMVAAIQPFISGSCSKTINVPNSATWEEIRDLYVLAWKLGVKCMSVYRDGSKARQVLSTKSKVEVLSGTVPAYGGPRPRPENLDEIELMSPDVWKEAQQYQGGPRPPGVHADEIPQAETPYAEDAMEGPVGSERRRMPRDAQMLRHKWNLGGHEGYLMVGLYEDGTPGEIFLEDIGKEGSHVKGMTAAWAIQCSTALQYGQPLEVMVRKFTNMNFEPNGRTECPEIPTAQSLPDYVMRWLALKFLPHMHEELGILTPEVKRRKVSDLDLRDAIVAAVVDDGNGDATIDPDLLVKGVAPYLGMVTSPNGHGRTEVVGVETSGAACQECGGLLQRAGSCLTCRCGWTSGCG